MRLPRWQRLLILAHLILGATAARGQGLSLAAPGQSSGGGRVLAQFPLVTSGPLITEDANTVAHVYWNGTALVDTKGNAWTQNGTVPQTSAAAYPFTATGRGGGGPFSTSNYYSLGTGVDVLDFAGDFTLCATFIPGSLAATQTVMANPTVSEGGYGAFIRSPSGYWGMTNNMVAAPGYQVIDTTTSLAAGVVAVGCIGRSGNNCYAKANLGATVTAACTPTKNVSAPATIGNLGTSPHTGTIYEVWASSTPFTEGQVVEIMQKVLGHYDGSSALLVTRTTTATYAPRSAEPYTLFTVPAGVARVTDQGLLVEPSRSNAILQSSTMSTTTSATSPWALTNATVATVAGAPMGGTWAEVTSTTNTGSISQNATTASSATVVLSVWAAAASGTTGAAAQVHCGAGINATACTCLRSDGGACTPTIDGNEYCVARIGAGGVTTAPVRLAALATCASAGTSHRSFFIPGVYGTSTGTTRFGGAQLEVGTTVSSLIPTTTAAVPRNSDQVSATVPAVTGLNWCIASTAEPYGKRAWGGTDRIWSLGTSGANTASLDLASTFTVTDAAAGVKSVGTGSTPSTASHRIVACDKGGSLALSLDGAIASPGTGAGTGILGTASAAFYLGGASASLYGGVYLKSMRICSAGNAKACESARAPASTTLASTFVAAYGDSLTGGELLTTPYPLLLGSLLGSTYAVTNKGVSGDTTSAINTRWGADNIRVNYLVLMGGINDIRVGTSAATTWTSLKATVDSAVARGVTVILGNVTPFNNYGGVYTVEKEAERQSLNSTIAAYCNGTTIRCVDVDALLRDPSDPTKLLPAYDYGDHIHHTQIAAAAMAAAFRAAIP